MLRFDKKYLGCFVGLLIVEIFIASFVRDAFVRPFVGDVLVVVLIYCFLMSFLNFKFWKVALGVLVFAFLIETLQFFDFVKLLGLENFRVLSVMLGRTFSWLDFTAYLTGFLIIILTERKLE